MTTQETKNYTGREGLRTSFAGDIIYREYKDSEGQPHWEGYSHSDDVRIEDFHEVCDSLPDKYRTDTEGLDLETAPLEGLVDHWGNCDKPAGAMYDDYTRTTYYNDQGDQVYYLRHARYALSYQHVESRGCNCRLNPCECPDEVWQPYEDWAMFKRVANGWIQILGDR